MLWRGQHRARPRFNYCPSMTSLYPQSQEDRKILDRLAMNPSFILPGMLLRAAAQHEANNCRKLMFSIPMAPFCGGWWDGGGDEGGGNSNSLGSIIEGRWTDPDLVQSTTRASFIHQNSLNVCAARRHMAVQSTERTLKSLGIF